MGIIWTIIIGFIAGVIGAVVGAVIVLFVYGLFAGRSQRAV